MLEAVISEEALKPVKEELAYVKKTDRIDDDAKLQRYKNILFREYIKKHGVNVDLIHTFMVRNNPAELRMLFTHEIIQQRYPIMHAVMSDNRGAAETFVTDQARMNTPEARDDLQLAYVCACKFEKLVFVELFLLEPFFYTNAEFFENPQFSPVVNDLIRLMKPSRTHDPEFKWKGESKESLEQKINTLYWENRGKPSEMSICPICCVPVQRGEGCRLLYDHVCIEANLHSSKRLWLEYRRQNRRMQFEVNSCIQCGRICNNHHHYSKGSIYDRLTILPISNTNWYSSGVNADRGCTDNGGGGEVEKIMRITRYIDTIKRLEPLIGTISNAKAMILIAESMWNCGVNVEFANAIIARKKFDIPEMNFEVFRSNARNEPPDVPRNPADVALLPKLVLPPTSNADSVANDNRRHTKNELELEMYNHKESKVDNEPVLQFNHRQRDGVVNEHKTTKITAENLVGLIKYRLDNGFRNITLVQCWYNVPGMTPGGKKHDKTYCTAIIHPDELHHLVTLGVFPDELYQKYKTEFNRHYPAIAASGFSGGAKKKSRKTQRKARGRTLKRYSN
jgi:hypothetical protein